MPEVFIATDCPSGHGAMEGPVEPEFHQYMLRQRAQENWQRIIEKVKTVRSGSFPKSLPITPSYYLELLDPLHRYGPDVAKLYRTWRELPKKQLFLDWLTTVNTPMSKGVIQVPADKLKDRYRIRLVGDQIFLPKKFHGDWIEFIEKRAEDKDRELIFVMDRMTYIYVGIKIPGRFQHSSFFCGKPVKMAGTFKVTKDWRITRVTNGSGHYMPGETELVDFLTRLRDGGVDLSTLDLKVWGGHDWTYDGKAKSWFTQKWWKPFFVRGGTLQSEH